MMFVYDVRKSVAEADAYFAVKGPPGFLQTEIVVQPFVGEVAAFEGEVVPPVP